MDLKYLHATKTEEKDGNLQDEPARTVLNIKREKIEGAVKSTKNRKSPDSDGISNELIKYGSVHLVIEITKPKMAINENKIATSKIPNERRDIVTILVFK